MLTHTSIITDNTRFIRQLFPLLLLILLEGLSSHIAHLFRYVHCSLLELLRRRYYLSFSLVTLVQYKQTRYKLSITQCTLG